MVCYWVTEVVGRRGEGRLVAQLRLLLLSLHNNDDHRKGDFSLRRLKDRTVLVAFGEVEDEDEKCVVGMKRKHPSSSDDPKGAAPCMQDYFDDLIEKNVLTCTEVVWLGSWFRRIRSGSSINHYFPNPNNNIDCRLIDITGKASSDDLPFLVVPLAKNLRFFAETHDKFEGGNIIVGFAASICRRRKPIGGQEKEEEKYRLQQMAEESVMQGWPRCAAVLDQVCTLWPNLDSFIVGMLVPVVGDKDTMQIAAQYLIDPRYPVLGHLISKLQATRQHHIQNDCDCCS